MLKNLYACEFQSCRLPAAIVHDSKLMCHEHSVVPKTLQRQALPFQPEAIVDHPIYYGGKNNPYEVIKVLKAWRLEEDALLWNMGKYLGRWDTKGTVREQLAKSIWYGLRRLAILDGLTPDTYNDAIKTARKATT